MSKEDKGKIVFVITLILTQLTAEGILMIRKSMFKKREQAHIEIN